MEKSLLILTGERGLGKTTLLKELILDGGLAVQGFLSLKDFSRPGQEGIVLVTLPEGKRLAVGTTAALKTGLSTAKYNFDEETFAYIDERFEHIRPDLPFVFDEFGKLELRGRGHARTYQRLRETAHPTLLVVRKELLEFFITWSGEDLAEDIADLSSAPRLQVAARLRDFLVRNTVLPE